MPIVPTIPRVTATALGAQVLFPYAWPILDASELRVYLNGTLLVLNVQYTVTGVGQPGGNVILATGAFVGDLVTILGEVPLSQGTSYTEHGNFPALAHEGALDKLTRISQQLQEQLNRSVRLKPTTLLGAIELPDPATLVTSAGGRKAIVWNQAETNLDLIELVSQTGIVGDMVPSILFGDLPPAGMPGRLRHLYDVDQFAIDDGVVWHLFTPGNELIMAATTRALLGTAGGVNTGKARYLTDAPLAVAISDGAVWRELPIGGIGSLAGSAFFSLPSASPAGQMQRVTDSVRGMAVSNGTTWVTINAPTYRPEDYPAADFGASLNACIAAMPATGGTIDCLFASGAQSATVPILINKPVRLILGEMVLTSTATEIFSVVAPGPVVISGISRSQTFIRTTTVGQNGIAIAQPSPVRIEHLTIDHSGAQKNNGSGIYLTGDGVNSNGFSRLVDLNIVDQWQSVATISAASWIMCDCYIVNSVAIGVDVQNQLLPDAGDSTIYGCTFDSVHVGVNVAAIFQHHSGGLRIINNKILSHYYGYVLDIVGSTIILLIEGNSIENQAGPSIALGRSVGVETFHNIIITGNQFSNANNACIACASDAIRNVLIADNIMGFLSPHAAISLTAINRAAIHGNMFFSSGGTSVGVAVGAGALGVDVGPNTYFDVTSPVSYQNVTATYSSFKAPTLTTAQRDAMSLVQNGMFIDNITTGKVQVREGGAWVNVV